MKFEAVDWVLMAFGVMVMCLVLSAYGYLAFKAILEALS